MKQIEGGGQSGMPMRTPLHVIIYQARFATQLKSHPRTVQAVQVTEMAFDWLTQVPGLRYHAKGATFRDDTLRSLSLPRLSILAA